MVSVVSSQRLTHLETTFLVSAGAPNLLLRDCRCSTHVETHDGSKQQHQPQEKKYKKSHLQPFLDSISTSLARVATNQLDLMRSKERCPLFEGQKVLNH